MVVSAEERAPVWPASQCVHGLGVELDGGSSPSELRACGGYGLGRGCPRRPWPSVSILILFNRVGAGGSGQGSCGLVGTGAVFLSDQEC